MAIYEQTQVVDTLFTKVSEFSIYGAQRPSRGLGAGIGLCYADQLLRRKCLSAECESMEDIPEETYRENSYLYDTWPADEGERSSLIQSLSGPVVSGGTIQADPVVKNWAGRYTLSRGSKAYEGTNHLGNVLSVVSDLKIGMESGTPDGKVDFYTSDVVSLSDYWPFGAPLQERSYSSQRYRFGFQRQVQDDEVMGEGNAVSFKYRVHDARVGRFFSVDPLAAHYPQYSAYQFSGNMPIAASDLEGAEPKKSISKWKYYWNYENLGDAYFEGNSQLQIVGSYYVYSKTIWDGSSGGLTLYYHRSRSNSTDGWKPFVPKGLDEYAASQRFDIETIMAYSQQMGGLHDGFLILFGGEAAILIGGYVILLAGPEAVAAYVLEEIGETAFEAATGIPVILGPDDLVQIFGKKGAKKLSKQLGLCFTGETIVKTSNGDLAISEVSIGDSVWTINLKSLEPELQRISSVSRRITDEIIEVHLGSNKLRSTKDHPFWVSGKWIEAENLKQGDHLRDIHGRSVGIDSVSRVQTVVDVYNLSVENNPVYHVGDLGILVHNNGGCDAGKLVEPSHVQGATLANEGGVKIVSYGSGDVHKPAHAHVFSKGKKQTRIGQNGKPIKGQRELTPGEKSVISNNIKKIRKHLKKVGKANKKFQEFYKKKE